MAILDIFKFLFSSKKPPVIKPIKTIPRVLFILKRREDFNLSVTYSQDGLSTGLLNSATFVNDMLNVNNITSKMVVVIDNNDIDREVAAFKPTHVIIEALWVTPTKFSILQQLHPHVTWVVRIHSEMPFIANEGVAMEWLPEYIKHQNVVLGVNSLRCMRDLNIILKNEKDIKRKIVYLPNYYKLPKKIQPVLTNEYSPHINIGCFGAIRPLKNHLTQAVAAIDFAERIHKCVHFHINIGRIEMKGDSIYRNLIALFETVKDRGHKLVVHEWVNHKDFIKLVKTMDIGMQVSYSETFNIVAADFISQGVPVVISKELPWGREGIADCSDVNNISNTLIETWFNSRRNIVKNVDGLTCYLDASTLNWKQFLSI